jgi:hypothetical protein
VKPATNYPFSLWVSIHSPDGTSKGINVTQATTCQGQSTTYNWVAGQTTLTSDGPFVQFAGTVAVPNCTVTQLVLYVEGGAGADLYVDDVQVLDTVTTPANLIPDGAFEAGQGSWFASGATTFGVVSSSAHSGTQSLKGGGLAANALLGRDIKALVTPGKKYTASAWVSVNAAAGSGLAKWQTIRNCAGDAGDSYPGMAFPTVTNGSWVQVTGTIDLSACTTVNKLILFAGADSGDLYLDDVTLTPIP